MRTGEFKEYPRFKSTHSMRDRIVQWTQTLEDTDFGQPLKQQATITWWCTQAAWRVVAALPSAHPRAVGSCSTCSFFFWGGGEKSVPIKG